jgi:hypothetical protein
MSVRLSGYIVLIPSIDASRVGELPDVPKGEGAFVTPLSNEAAQFLRILIQRLLNRATA